MSAQSFISSLNCDLYSSKIKHAIEEVYTAIDTDYTLSTPTSLPSSGQYTLLHTINQFQCPELTQWNSDIHSLEDSSDGGAYNTQMVMFLDYSVELYLLCSHFNALLGSLKSQYNDADDNRDDKHDKDDNKDGKESNDNDTDDKAGGSRRESKAMTENKVRTAVEDFRLMSLELPRVLYRMLRLLLVPLQSIESVSQMDLDLGPAQGGKCSCSLLLYLVTLLLSLV